MRLNLIFVLLFVPYFLSANASQERGLELKKIHEQAVVEYRDGNYEQALSSFSSGAMLAEENFKIASFYYNAGNSAYKNAEKQMDINIAIENLEAALDNYERCLDFHPEFESAVHNGEMAMLFLEKLKEQNKGEEQNSAADSLDELINDQKNLNSKASGENQDITETAERQEKLGEKTEELSQQYSEIKKELLQASEIQKEASNLFRLSEKEEGLEKQEQALEVLEAAAEKIEKAKEDSRNESKEALANIIDQLESQKEYEVIRQSGNSAGQIEKDW